MTHYSTDEDLKNMEENLKLEKKADEAHQKWVDATRIMPYEEIKLLFDAYLEERNKWKEHFMKFIRSLVAREQK